jgi:hypothetical protein
VRNYETHQTEEKNGADKKREMGFRKKEKAW